MNFFIRVIAFGRGPAGWGRARALAALEVATLLLVSAAAVDVPPPPAPATAPPVFGVSQWLLDPRQYPDYARHPVKPPSWDTFGQRPHFTTLRGFDVEGGRIVGYTNELERYTRTFGLGDVIWPSYPILFATNLAALADQFQQRHLFLFDVWGYVPGSGPGGYWQQFTPPASAFALLDARLGARWLGTDIGEQDGRYIGGYAGQMTPAAGGRFEQYLNFQRHFARMSRDLGGRHATLVSLNYGHYLLKEGGYTMIGAETGQALPNSQVYYAFIRGAGKQYGVPWFGNASVFNRWGYKDYGPPGTNDGFAHGPTKGTSLSLLKRLLYSHLLYNSMAVGFETGWLRGDQLTPIGRVQQAARRWIAQHGPPGVMQTPVALLLDFYAGWTFPRHLYTDTLYRVWGNLPYGPGDYLTDDLLGVLYPRYQDSSYFHDETGFLSATPFNDGVDCLLSDAPGWLLARYPVVIVAGELAGGRELRDKLAAYVRGGGHLVLTAANLARLPEGLAGVATAEASRLLPAQTIVKLADGTRLTEPAFRCATLQHDGPVMTLAQTEPDGLPVAARASWGEGTLTVLAAPFGLPASPQAVDWHGPSIDRSLPTPYPLLAHVRTLLGGLLRRQMLFEAGDGLSLIVCRQGPGAYTLGVANNSWHERPLRIVSHCGPLQSLDELPLDASEHGAPGQVPEGLDPAPLGRSSAVTIAGGDVRVFAVRVREEGVTELPPPELPRPPHGRALPLGRPVSLQEAILARPTFFAHFDSVVVDWRYVQERAPAALDAEAAWARRQGLHLYVDLSSGLNLYPDLRLVDNLPADYTASMATIAEVLEKMQRLGAHDLILSLHRVPETNFTEAQTRAGFARALRELCQQAAARGLEVHLRLTPGKPPSSLEEAGRLLAQIDAPNLRLAPSLALWLASGASTAALESVRDKIGVWLVSTPRQDLAGRLWNVHAPLAGCTQLRALADAVALAPRAALLLDALYSGPDDEYLDAAALDELRAPGASAPR